MRLRDQVSPALIRCFEVGLILVLLVSPLLISTYLKQVFNTPKYVLVGGVAIALGCVHLVDCLLERRLRLPASAAGWSLLGFVAWCGLSLLWSSDMAVASRDLGYHAAMYLLFLAGFLYGREEERVDNLLHFPIAAGVIAAGFGLMQYYDLDAQVFRLSWLTADRLLAVMGAGLVAAGWRGLSRSGAARFGMMGLALLLGVAAGFRHGEVYALGLVVTGFWIFLRSLSPRESAVKLALRALVGMVLLLLAGLIDGQIVLVLGAAILLDESTQDGDEGLGNALLGVGLWMCAITAAMRGWDLAFLVLPKKPTEVVKIYSFMGHRNYLAGLLIAVLPLAVVRMIAIWCVVPAGESRFEPVRIWRTAVYMVAITLMVVVIVLCQTRGAWIGGLGSMFMLAIWVLLKYRPLRPLGLLAVSAAVITTVVFAFGWKRMKIPGFGEVSNPLNRTHRSAAVRLSDTLNIQRGSAFQRALIYRTTWAIIFENPVNCLFGTGIGTFGLHYMPNQKYVLKQPANRKYLRMTNKSIYAHNEYWHYWSEVGLVGLLLLFMFGYRLAEAAHRRLRVENAGVPNLMFLGMCCALGATTLHNIFTFDFHLAYSGAIFFTLSGIVLAQCAPEFWEFRWGGQAVAEVAAEAAYGDAGDDGAPTWARGTLAPVVGGLAVRVELRPPGVPAGHDLAVIGPKGERTPLAEVAPGEYEARVPEREGVFRVDLRDLDLDDLRLRYAAQGPSGDTALGILLAAGIALMMGRTLSSELLRDYYWRNAFLKFRMKRFEDAFLDFERAVEADPTKGEVLFDFGRALMDSQRDKFAIEVFKQAKATFVDPANDHNIALCYFKLKDKEKAEEHYRKALALNEIYEQSLANLAFLLITEKREDEALPLLERGMRIYPQNKRFVTSYAVVMAQKGEFEAAEVAYDKALKLETNRAAVYLNAGTVYFNLGKVEKAQAAFRRAVELEPDNQIAQRKLAGLRQRLAADQLTHWAEKATAEPQNLEARRNYAMALLATGRVGHAATEAKAVLGRYPTDPALRFTYARALQLQGYAADALREYRRVLTLKPAPEIARRAAARIQELEAAPATPTPGSSGAPAPGSSDASAPKSPGPVVGPARPPGGG